MNQTKSYRIVADEIPFEHDRKECIFKTYFAVSDYYKKYPNPGACHLISSILHVLFKEQGIDNDLCIGEVQTGPFYFDHSWIEVDGKIFDIAIQLGLDESINPPVYAGYDLLTEEAPVRGYGVNSPSGFDTEARRIYNTPFVKYMDAYPQFKEGSWKIVKVVGKELRLKFDINDLKKKYKDTIRVLKSKSI